MVTPKKKPSTKKKKKKHSGLSKHPECPIGRPKSGSRSLSKFDISQVKYNNLLLEALKKGHTEPAQRTFHWMPVIRYSVMDEPQLS
jgi:hypothetical protein